MASTEIIDMPIDDCRAIARNGRGGEMQVPRLTALQGTKQSSTCMLPIC